MSWLGKFFSNHVLANLTFLLVLTLGVISYFQMPRAKEPEINFNWINILTFFPGATAEDVEKRITDPIEDVLRDSIKDMKFVSSTSREGMSNILIRFEDIGEDVFYKRIIELRREVQNVYSDQLPEEIEEPTVYEITTSNSYPSANIIVTSAGDDENLRQQARNIKKDLELINGVDRITELGLADPELQIRFIPENLTGLGITPGDIADTVRAYFRDISAGDIATNDGQWIVRIAGTSADPEELAEYPVMSAKGIVPLKQLARFTRDTEESTEMVKFKGKPAVLMSVTKQANTNVLELVDDINAYIEKRNGLRKLTGVELALIDDQTASAREALSVMQKNAFIGLLMVLFVTWIFLGLRIAILTSIGIPFTLAGCFVILNLTDMSLNNTILLGVVIALGMLVDDAVVVVEAIYYRLQRGMQSMAAVLGGLREVFAPVLTAVLTTIAAFLPLMLMPGVLGQFMQLIPIVVTLSLLVSLVEAYWILPVHIVFARADFTRPSVIQQKRQAITGRLRHNYTRILVKILRYPRASLSLVLCIFALAITIVTSGYIRFNFFESEQIPLFYVNLDMPMGSSLEDTGKMLAKLEQQALTQIGGHELRSSVAYAGQQFTDTQPQFGDTVGQIMISLKTEGSGIRSVYEIANAVEAAVVDIEGADNISILRLEDGPPKSRPIQLKIRGDEIAEIRSATQAIVEFMNNNPLYNNITINDQPGNPELVLNYDFDAVQRAGITPQSLNRAIRSFIDGEVVTSFQDEGEKIIVRVQAEHGDWHDINELLRQTISLPDGGAVPIGELVYAEQKLGVSNIRHYNFKRAFTLMADIDEDKIDAVEANGLIKEKWQSIQQNYPAIDLDFTGLLDDIQESLDALLILFLLGIGLMYIILGAQFGSYIQPLMILISIPLGFTGVVFGLLITNNALSLYTLYGVVALSGISVNTAIVLISAANARLKAGMNIVNATVYAARRRVIPILITSLTTIAGLFSLATGLASDSLIWGPVATAIVWGLVFSTLLNLFVIPTLYRIAMQWR